MRISEAFCKMRLSEYCTSQDIDRAIAVTVDSFVASQKVSCKKALARAFAKYVLSTNSRQNTLTNQLPDILWQGQARRSKEDRLEGTEFEVVELPLLLLEI